MPELIAVMNKQAWVGCTCSTLQYPWCGSFCLSERRERVLCCASVRKVDLHLLMQMEFSFGCSCPVLFGSSHPMLAFLLQICQLPKMLWLHLLLF